MPSSSALWASIGPGMTSPIAQMPATEVRKSWSVSIWPRLLSSSPALSRPSPSVLGRRPIETSTHVGLDRLGRRRPLAGSTVSVALPPLTVAPVTLVASLDVEALLLEDLGASLRTSPSMPGRIWSRNSTTVTLAPSRRHTEPAPARSRRRRSRPYVSGTLASASAPVEIDDRSWSLSTSTPGRGVTDEPVAITMFLARDGLAADLDRIGAFEAGMALQPFDLVLLEQEFDAAGQALRPPCLARPCIASRSSSSCR